LPHVHAHPEAPAVAILVSVVRLASETIGGQLWRGGLGKAHAIRKELDTIVPTGQLDGHGEAGVHRPAVDDSGCCRVGGSNTATVGKRHHADHVALLVYGTTGEVDGVENVVQEVKRGIAIQRDVRRRRGRK